MTTSAANRALRWFASGFLCLLALPAVCLSADPVVYSGETMGTTFRVKVESGSIANTTDLQRAIEARLAEVDQRMSTYRDDSDVCRFNRAPSQTWVPVHEETAMVVQLAQQIAQETQGFFDCTVGPLVALWNFGPKREATFSPPDPGAVQATLGRTGYRHLQVRLGEAPALWKDIEGLSIDLSGIAKGYAVDVISELVTRTGATASMVEIGGEVRVHDTQGARSWRIGIEAPDPTGRRLDSVVPLTNQALASSGDYRNFFRHDGKTYSHTIDPHTGRPVTHTMAAVSILDPSCARADALATALLAWGPAAEPWAKQQGIQAMFFQRVGDEVVRTSTANFPQLEQATPQPAGNRFVAMAIASVVVFGLAILAMSIGTIVANKRLQGSCGGMAGLQDEHGRTLCDMCTKPSPQCSGAPEDTAVDA